MWRFIIQIVNAKDSNDVRNISVDVPVAPIHNTYFSAWDEVMKRAKDELSKLSYEYYIKSINNIV